MVMVFALALLVVYLVLVAQFESMLTPAVVMVTVPLGIFGGLLGLWLTGQEMSIYSQIGMIMLIGMVTKNGILIVEFINQLRQRGEAFDEAIIAGSVRRLRPILMTSLTAIIGAVPLMLSMGRATSRMSVGTVVFFGLSGDPGDPVAGARHLPSAGQTGRHDRGTGSTGGRGAGGQRGRLAAGQTGGLMPTPI